MKQPSDLLLELARHYLSIVDGSPDSESDPRRTEAHEALMDQLEAEHYPFQSRVEVRWLARWLVDGQRVATDYGEMRLMWAEISPVNGIIRDLHFFPPFDNTDGLTPVLVVPLPYSPYDAERSL